MLRILAGEVREKKAVVHRDIKPENILMVSAESDIEVKIMTSG